MTLKCPNCGSTQIREYYDGENHECVGCEKLFADDPDEGGDYATGDPSRRIMREEESKARRRARRGH